MNEVALANKPLTLPSDQDASGRSFDEQELNLIAEVLRTGKLISTKGEFVKRLEKEFAALLGVKHVHACASGTAAVHCAVAALDPEPGDEIITSPITDMGALAPILYQGAIPVFADVEPKTCNVTAATIAARLTERTRAIIVTHLFGNPCEMAEINALARQRNIPVVEDAAQSFLTTYDGKPAGALGTIGCFSLQQGKHMTTGEGGFVATNDDALARRMFLFINKAWGYGDAKPDHYFLALNYRMTELQGAMGLAQFRKLTAMVEHRICMAARLTEKLRGIPGIETPWSSPRARHTYWKYALRADASVIPGGAVALGKQLGELGVANAPRYIQKPAFQCEIFQQQRTFGKSRWPFTLARPEAVDYSRERFPGTFEALEGVLVLPWNERYTEEHVDYIADAVRRAVSRLREVAPQEAR
jgi:dTDP-4-amino-4,6-dideoxygalactose transaminase